MYHMQHHKAFSQYKQVRTMSQVLRLPKNFQVGLIVHDLRLTYINFFHFYILLILNFIPK